MTSGGAGVGSIAIVGLDTDAKGALDERTLARLRAAGTVVVVSAAGGAPEILAAAGIEHRTYAEIGIAEAAPPGAVVEALVALARDDDVALAVTTYPFVPEGVIAGLLTRAGTGVDVYPVVSPLQVLVLALDIDLTADVDILDAGSIANAEFKRDAHLIVTGVDNAIVARAVAERLQAFYAPDHTVIAAGWLEGGGFDLELMTVAGLGHLERVARDTALYVAPSRIVPPEGFGELVRIISVLRGPDGCPWDREQTHGSLAKHMVEEAYETVAAIEAADDAELAEELGDVLLQIVLHAQIAAEAGRFTIDDVIAGIIAKIRRRHPHVFGAVRADTAEEVTRNWEAIKRAEKGEARAEGALAGVTPTLPALMYAQELSRRAVAVGFEWETLDDVWDKVHEEIDELKATEPGSEEAEAELGDLLFTVVNVARKMGVDAEQALRSMCARFERRFERMERSAGANGTSLAELGSADLEDLWRSAKEADRTDVKESDR
ncbi:MAG: nucleoside triphosphate pyrophosphohydrolase [Coriobacteriia bacterium]